ncbi:hypothetical protein HaLaN_24128 [Haematococcus lacustris]|uniref:Uncharacterized protein n=1 Tax=Haematococcus lacustris TaxID=44745 RepID=A0A699ZXZ6_HAELA|nr:hypothetical protein HaLaN_24128 [Haematococcus lacustris]
MSRFQFDPAQFIQAEQVLSRLVTVDGSQADQPLAMVLEQLRRGWGALASSCGDGTGHVLLFEIAIELEGCNPCSSSGWSALGLFDLMHQM